MAPETAAGIEEGEPRQMSKNVIPESIETIAALSIPSPPGIISFKIAYILPECKTKTMDQSPVPWRDPEIEINQLPSGLMVEKNRYCFNCKNEATTLPRQGAGS
jgi:hypothetical protein